MTRVARNTFIALEVLFVIIPAFTVTWDSIVEIVVVICVLTTLTYLIAQAIGAVVTIISDRKKG